MFILKRIQGLVGAPDDELGVAELGVAAPSVKAFPIILR